MKRNIKRHITACDVCQINKSKFVVPPDLLQPLSILEKDEANISMDFIEGLSPTNMWWLIYYQSMPISLQLLIYILPPKLFICL